MIPEKECFICHYVNKEIPGKKPKKKKGFWGRLVEEPEPVQKTYTRTSFKIGGVEYKSWDEVPDEHLHFVPRSEITENIQARIDAYELKKEKERKQQAIEEMEKAKRDRKELKEKYKIKKYWDVNGLALDFLFDNYSDELPEKVGGRDPREIQDTETNAFSSFYNLELETAKELMGKVDKTYDDPADKAAITFFNELLEEPGLYRKIADTEKLFFNSIQSVKKSSRLLDKCNDAIASLKELAELPDNNFTVFNLINGLINEMRGVLAWNFDRDVEKAIEYLDEACDSYFLIADCLRLERAGFAALGITFCNDPEHHSGLENKESKYKISTGELPIADFTLASSLSWSLVKFTSIHYRHLRIQEYLQRHLDGFQGIKISRTPMGTKINLKLHEPETFTDQQNEELTKILEDYYKFDKPKITVHEQGVK